MTIYPRGLKVSEAASQAVRHFTTDSLVSTLNSSSLSSSNASSIHPPTPCATVEVNFNGRQNHGKVSSVQSGLYTHSQRVLLKRPSHKRQAVTPPTLSLQMYYPYGQCYKPVLLQTFAPLYFITLYINP